MAAEADPPKPATIAGLTWWQALLLYPTLAASLFAAVPRVWEEVKALRLGVARSELQAVQEQETLWRANLDCIQQQGMYEADGVEGVVVKVTLCPSADVLLRYYYNDWGPVFKWVSRPKPTTKKGAP